MTKLSLFARVVLLGAGLLLTVPPSVVEARPGPAKKKEEPAQEPATLPKAPRLKPAGLRYGNNFKQVAKVYDRAIEEDYRPRMKKVEPGIAMERLRYEIDQAKQAFRMSRVDFDGKPNNLDATPLAVEFTNYNKESMMTTKREGRSRYLFFIQKKLWKAVDVYDLKSGGKWGPDFKTAVEKVQKKLKVDGRALPADEEKGRKYEEVDWTDGTTHLRLVNWGKQLAIVYVEVATEKRLAELRKNKGPVEGEIDPSVKKVLR